MEKKLKIIIIVLSIIISIYGYIQFTKHVIENENLKNENEKKTYTYTILSFVPLAVCLSTALYNIYFGKDIPGNGKYFKDILGDILILYFILLICSLRKISERTKYQFGKDFWSTLHIVDFYAFIIYHFIMCVAMCYSSYLGYKKLQIKIPEEEVFLGGNQEIVDLFLSHF